MKGQNLYHLPSYEAKAQSSKTCIFISHRLADIDVARAIADFLTDTVGVNIYFSDDDQDLQQAVEEKDDKKIVEYIENGLAVSSHLLGVISNKTRGSWWVPFEIGSRRQRKTSIAQLLLEEVEELPSYLKISNLLKDRDDLETWIETEIKSRIIWEKYQAKGELPNIPKVAKYQFKYPTFHKLPIKLKRN